MFFITHNKQIYFRSKHFFVQLLLVTAIFFLQPTVLLADWSGQVVWIQDGDSLIIKRGRKRVTVRLQGIDAPEKGQPYAAHAKKAAIRLVKNRNVRVLVKEKDKFGRTVARVILPDGRNLSHVMVDLGWAWRHIY
jgi:micrococcal nuclease